MHRSTTNLRLNTRHGNTPRTRLRRRHRRLVRRIRRLQLALVGRRRACTCGRCVDHPEHGRAERNLGALRRALHATECALAALNRERV